MPAVSPAQERLMQAAAHIPGGYGGVPQSVGKEFVGDRDEHPTAPNDEAPSAEAIAAALAQPMEVRAAGILFQAADGRVLFLKRGDGGDFPGSWCIPGGHHEEGETILETAKREAREELGSLPEGEPVKLSRFVAEREGKRVDFTTFAVRVDETFEPKLNGEHTGWAWALPSAPPEPLHPGCVCVMAKLGANELGIARLMAFDGLESPQRYGKMHLFDMRITGTGAAYRLNDDEFVWRDPSLCCNDEFLARCNGLPVVFEHPDKAILDSKEFSDRIVGTIMLPYIKGEEVWGIARIYDDETAEMLSNVQLSTSPGVVLTAADLDNKIELDSGKMLLVEGKPSLIDHLAICEQGVWDKAMAPKGVRLDSAKQGAGMAEEAEREEDKKADAAKKDADDMPAKIQAIADAVGKLSARMDAMDASKKDAAEEDEKKADAEDEKSEEKKADKAKKDADEDDGDKAAKADSVPAEVMNQIRDLQSRIPAALSDADVNALADAQEKADAVASAFGERSIRPMAGETPINYRRRIASKYRDHSPDWKGVDLAALPDAALAVAEKAIFADAIRAADEGASAPNGGLVRITKSDDTGRRYYEYRGSPSAWMDGFAMRPKIAAGFNTKHGA